MAYRIEIAPIAMQQADEARDWIAQRSPVRAEAWHQPLFEAIESLSPVPMRCPVAPESDAFGEEVRELLYGKRQGVYRILFALKGDVIRVLMIWYGARGSLSP